MRRRSLVWLFTVLASIAFAPQAAAQQSCESLISLKLPHVDISSATLVRKKPFTAPRPGLPPGPTLTLPAHCEVKGISRPTSDSEIKFEVWLPMSSWNGKYQQVGNGGWAGSI